MPKAPRRGLCDHDVFWTGNEMILLGGLTYKWGGGTQAAAFSPARNSWRLLPAPPIKKRSSYASVFTGEELIIWGGGDSRTEILSDGAVFDLKLAKWRHMSKAPIEARAGATAVWSGRKMLVVFGGNGPSGSLTDGGAYDPATDSWRPISRAAPQLPVEKQPDRHLIHEWGLWTGKRMLVLANYSETNIVGGGRILSYDPAGDAWATLEAPAMYHTALDWTGSDLIVWGTTPKGEALGFLLDPTTGKLRRLPAAPDVLTPDDTGSDLWQRIVFVAGVWTGREFIVWGGTEGGPEESRAGKTRSAGAAFRLSAHP